MALFQGDVKSNVATSSATVVASPARVRGINFVAHASAGSIIIKDGGSSGAVVLSVATPASGYGNIQIPADGILCSANVYVALTNITSATVIYS